MAEKRPTLEELREFRELPWIRCSSCGKVTAHLQERFNKILEEKSKIYYENVVPLYNTLLEQGFEDIIAQQLADKQARIIADVTFHERAEKELGLKRYCCFKTLQNPIILPLGSGIDLDPDVDVGERLSRLQLKETSKPETKEEVKQRRVYRAV